MISDEIVRVVTLLRLYRWKGGMFSLFEENGIRDVRFVGYGD